MITSCSPLHLGSTQGQQTSRARKKASWFLTSLCLFSETWCVRSGWGHAGLLGTVLVCWAQPGPGGLCQVSCGCRRAVRAVSLWRSTSCSLPTWGMLLWRVRRELFFTGGQQVMVMNNDKAGKTPHIKKCLFFFTSAL